MVGPAVGGLLVALTSEGWCFLINGLSFLAVLTGLYFMTVPKRPAPSAEDGKGGVAQGIAFAARTEPYRSLLLLVATLSLAGMPFTVLLPVFATQLQAGPDGYGLLMGAVGMGALAGAIRLATQRDSDKLNLLPGLAAGGMGIGLVLLGLAPSFWLSEAALLVIGFCLITTTATCNTLLQSHVPDRLRGRIMACYMMCFAGLAPFGALAAGGVAHRIGAATTVMIGGGICLAAGGRTASTRSACEPGGGRLGADAASLFGRFRNGCRPAMAAPSVSLREPLPRFAEEDGVLPCERMTFLAGKIIQDGTGCLCHSFRQ
jgi:predicted MFS family arabinose efflux permease